MKFNLLTIAALATSIFMASCGGTETTTESTEATTTEETAEAGISGTFTTDASASEVAWKGEVAGVYGHSGIINITEGNVVVDNGAITSGEFVIDMTTITPTDSSYEYNEKSNPENLKGHLSNGDFFLVDSFPTAKFVIKSATETSVTGDLTIRDKTKSETFALSTLDITEEGVTAKGSLTFNRQDYGVAWVHYMKDMVLSNDITIDVTLVTKK